MILPLFNDPPHGLLGRSTFHRHRPLFPSPMNHQGTADYILSRIRLLLAFRCKDRQLFTAIVHFSLPPRTNSRLYFKFIHQIHITDFFENLCFISVQMQESTTFHRPLFSSPTNHEADYILSRIRVLLVFRCKYL